MERGQFTFYMSFFKAISRIKEAADRAAAYDAVCAYALCEIEPDIDALPDAAAVAFEVARAIVDTDRRKAANASKRETKENKAETNENKPKTKANKLKTKENKAGTNAKGVSYTERKALSFGSRLWWKEQL